MFVFHYFGVSVFLEASERKPCLNSSKSYSEYGLHINLCDQLREKVAIKIRKTIVYFCLKGCNVIVDHTDH